MKKVPLLIFLISILVVPLTPSHGAELPKVAVWDLTSGDLKAVYAQDLTLVLVSEIAKLKKYEVYSQENVRTIAGWTEERMKLGCTSTQCLTALGQMDIAKLISGRIGKVGNRYSVSLNLFDTQNAKAESAVSEFGSSENELIDLVQVAARALLGVEIVPTKVEEKVPEKVSTLLAASVPERLGVTVRPFSPEETTKYGRAPSQGVVIVTVEPQGPLGKAGFEMEDIILDIDGQLLKGYDRFVNLVSLLRPKQKIRILVLDHRSGNIGYVEVTVR